MVIQVNKELCGGCGVCVDACSVGAILLVDQWAVIDDALCTACEACIGACPNEAITMRSVPEPSVSIVTPPVAESRVVPVREQATLPETAVPASGARPWAGAALAFLRSEIAPRLVDVLITALERRLSRPTTTTIAPTSLSSRTPTAKTSGERRQARYRGGCTGNKNHKERR